MSSNVYKLNRNGHNCKTNERRHIKYERRVKESEYYKRMYPPIYTKIKIVP